MLRRLPSIKLPLAVKCQLLFGIAALLIIAAALWVPFRRMEQLTEQIDESSARTVADVYVGQHVRAMRERQPGPASQPATQLSERLSFQSTLIDPPKLLAVESLRTPEMLDDFELAAFARFVRRPDRPSHIKWGRSDNGLVIRYAQPLLRTGSCVLCHALPEETRDTSPRADASTKELFNAPPADLVGLVEVEIPSQISSQQILLNRVFLLAAGLLAGLCAIVVLSLVITRLILRPVRVLQETAERVSEGDLDIRSDISTGDEFQQLSETQNTMLKNLKSSADALRSANKSLDLRLEQMAEANIALFESNRLKSEFLANVSHELRTPLNSILGFAELLKDQVATNPKPIRYVQNISDSGTHLLELINDLLDLAKIEAGRMEVRAGPLSLPDLFEGLVGLLRPLAEPRSLSILRDVGGDVPILHSDGSKLQQVLYNLLSNAIKFSPDGATIQLRAERIEDGLVKISVIDQGPGIAAKDQEIIFEKFRQLDAGVTRKFGGTGLGLSISRELARLLGGRMGVVSEAGHGAAFWILLPPSIESSDQSVSDLPALR